MNDTDLKSVRTNEVTASIDEGWRFHMKEYTLLDDITPFLVHKMGDTLIILN